MTGRYYINGLDLYSEYGVTVLKSEGEIDILKPKARLKVEWPDENGEDVDLSETLFEPRRISLECMVQGEDAAEALSNISGLMATLNGSGLKILKSFKDNFNSHYIYLDSPNGGIQRFNQGSLLLFKLNLIEPQPVFRKHSVTATIGMTVIVTINLSTEYPIDIHWGDGQVSNNVTSTQQHIYTMGYDSNSYEIAVFGQYGKATTYSFLQQNCYSVTYSKVGAGDPQKWIEFSPAGHDLSDTVKLIPTGPLTIEAFPDLDRGWSFSKFDIHDEDGDFENTYNPLTMGMYSDKIIVVTFVQEE